MAEGSHESRLYELDLFNINKADSNPHCVSAVVENIRKYGREIKEHAASLGLVPLSSLPFPTALEMAISVTATSGSPSIWFNYYRLDPNTVPRSKIGVLNAVGMERLAADMKTMLESLLSNIYCYGPITAATNCLVHVYSKREPFKMKKLLSGRHRTIQMPEWSNVVLEAIHSCYYDPSAKRVYTLDDVMSSMVLSRLDGWCVGQDVLIKTFRFCESQASPPTSYDVEGWDRSLSSEFILAVYESTVFDPSLATYFAHAYNGGGVYEVDGKFLRFKENPFAWCSGASKTLSGNSLIHASILRTFNQRGLVMGDDGLVEGKWEGIHRDFASIGMKIKVAEHLEFCGVEYADHVLKLDLKKILGKSVAKVGSMTNTCMAAYGVFAAIQAAERHGVCFDQKQKMEVASILHQMRSMGLVI